MAKITAGLQQKKVRKVSSVSSGGSSLVWPYGKFKGSTLRKLKSSYLRWVIAESAVNSRTLFKGPLLKEVISELAGRQKV